MFVDWDAATDGTEYTLTFTLKLATEKRESVMPIQEKSYFIKAEGDVTVELVAHKNGQDSAPVTATVAVWNRVAVTTSCPTRQCSIPLHGGGWQQGDVITTATAAPVHNGLGRYGSAAGLLALAGLIRWGRFRQQRTAVPEAPGRHL